MTKTKFIGALLVTIGLVGIGPNYSPKNLKVQSAHKRNFKDTFQDEYNVKVYDFASVTVYRNWQKL